LRREPVAAPLVVHNGAVSDDAAASELTNTSRLEAFSDGVMAVIITIMAFELRAPGGAGFSSLEHRLPALLVYILSFTFVGIYWNNHHHLLRSTPRLSSAVMWANMVLLFWLSLIPVMTEWVADYYRYPWPAAAYGIVGLAAALSFTVLVRAILRANPDATFLAEAVGSDRKGQISLGCYALGIALAFVSWVAAYALYAIVSAIWFIPDRRLTRVVRD
jgi:uncharacterized membrane protein